MKFSETDLRAFIGAVSEHFGLDISVDEEKPIITGTNHIRFEGMAPNMRKSRIFVVPFEQRFNGVMTPKSVLCSTGRGDIGWLLNGQAAKGCRELIHIGSSSDQAISLHASKEMVREWIFSRLEGMPEDRIDEATRHFEKDYGHYMSTGLYADEVSVGRYRDSGGATLVLDLTALHEPQMATAPSVM